MGMPLELHVSKQGYVFPSQAAEDIIYKGLDQLSQGIPEEEIDEVMFVTDQIVDQSFEAGWFYDDLNDERTDVLIQKAKEAGHVFQADSPEIKQFYRTMAKKAICVGSQACRETYVILMNGKDED